MESKYYFYILRSIKTGGYYKGVTHQLYWRLREHNRGKNPSTKAGSPWGLVYCEPYESRTEALQSEWQVKKWGYTDTKAGKYR